MNIEDLAGEVVEAARGFVQRSLMGVHAKLAELDARLAAIPVGPKGDPGERGERGEAGPQGERGEPGAAGEAGAMGEAGPRGEVGPQGPQGAAGERGESGIRGEVGPPGPQGRDGRDGLPGLAGKDGAPGANGRDGFGLEDFEMELGEDGRTLSLRFVRGETVIERKVKIPTMQYREVWREGEYERGDVVTWDGSGWHCQQQTTDRPGGGSTAWRLMVKRGAPGKDGAAPTPPTAAAPVRVK